MVGFPCKALKLSSDDKARYRRATALLRLGRTEEARKDVEELASRGVDPGVQRLQAELAGQ